MTSKQSGLQNPLDSQCISKSIPQGLKSLRIKRQTAKTLNIIVLRVDVHINNYKAKRP